MRKKNENRDYEAEGYVPPAWLAEILEAYREQNAVAFRDKCREAAEHVVTVEGVIRTGEEFAAATIPDLSAASEQGDVRQAATDRPPSKTTPPDKDVRREPSRRKFRRLAWAGGLAGLCVVVLFSLVCSTLSKKVDALRQDLQVAERDVALARAERQLKDAREREEREQKAITALYLRMGELEQRFDQVYSPRTAFLPTAGAGLNTLSEGRSPL